MPYLGVAPNPRQNREVDDISSSFNGSTTAFTLQTGGSNVSPGSDTAIIVSLGGVIQNPGTDYTIAASTITFTTAPASGLSFFGVVLAQSIDIETTADGTVTNAKVNASAAIAGTKISPDFGSQNIVTTGSITGNDLEIDSGTLSVDATNNRVGIGITSPTDKLHVRGASANFTAFILDNATNSSSPYKITFGDQGQVNHLAVANREITFGTNNSERLRIDNTGRVGIGTTSPEALKLHLYDATDTSSSREQFRISGGDRTSDNFETGIRFFTTSPSTNGNRHYRLTANGNTGLLIQGHETSTGNVASDRAVLLNPHGGNVLIGTTNVDGDGLSIKPRVANQTTRIVFNRATTTDNGTALEFLNNSTTVGTIKYTNSATQYNTSSDYRLKENATAISDGITRLKTLKPYRFNFKVNPSTTVDGFFAHEVTAVPEAITGTKDETQDILYTEEDTIPSGKKVGDVKETVPNYQGIDQSKLVPLLTAALQEAITKIETLETKVAALE